MTDYRQIIYNLNATQ